MPTTQVGSHTVYYDEHGNGQPLLLIVGQGGRRLGWWKQIEPLSRQFRVLNMDNRDAGDSALSPDPYTIADMADDTAGLIQNLQLGPTYVVGWSMGGFIALELALRHPALVKKLILVATSAVRPEITPEMGAFLQRIGSADIETRARLTYHFSAGQGHMEAHPEDLDHLVSIALTKPMSLEANQRQINAAMTWGGVSDRLAQGIAVPTLVIHGDADAAVPSANGQYLAAHIPNAKLSTYAGVGHLVPIEAAERFNREVLEFISS